MLEPNQPKTRAMELMTETTTDPNNANLLGMDLEIDPAAYKENFKPKAKNSKGIPLSIEAEVAQRGQLLAEAYEQLYHSRKMSMKEANYSSSQLLQTDGGGAIALNLAAVATAPVFVRALEEGDDGLYAVPALQWMRASGDKEWVFSHLCEAVYGYYNVKTLREQIGRKHEDAYEDLRDYLRDALYHYAHRHC